VQQKRHHLKKDARSLDDIIQALGGSAEIAGYDNAEFTRRAGDLISRAATRPAEAEGPAQRPPCRLERRVLSLALVRSNPPKQHENDHDDQDGADDTDTAVTVAVAIAAETAAETAEQEDDKNDE
jgi:hypothetical protein